MSTTNTPAKFFVRIPNKAFSEALQDRLFALGYSWPNAGQNHIKSRAYRSAMPDVVVRAGHRDDKKHIGWSSLKPSTLTRRGFEELTLDQLFQMEAAPEVATLKVEQYMVTYHKGDRSIVVGCKGFDVEELLEFADQVAEARTKIHTSELVADMALKDDTIVVRGGYKIPYADFQKFIQEIRAIRG